jgi:RNA polymerase sigma-70 factor, ECF subfamily
MTEQIWQQHYQRVRRFVQSRVQDEALAADITQDVFLKAYMQLAQLQNPDRMQSWLMSIAQHRMMDYYRRAGKTAPDWAAVVPDSVALEPMTDWIDNPKAVACMEYMLSLLPEQHRDILIQADLRQVPQRVLAEQMGIPYSTLKSRVQRARAQLRAIMLECCQIESDSYGNILQIERKNDRKARAHQAAIDGLSASKGACLSEH